MTAAVVPTHLTTCSNSQQTPLHMAVTTDNDEACELIINHQQCAVTDRQLTGENCLHLAVCGAKSDDVELKLVRLVADAAQKQNAIDSVNFEGCFFVY